MSLRIWEVNSGRLVYTFSGHKRRINACAYTNDNLYIALASWDCTIKIWNLNTGDKDPVQTISNGTCLLRVCC